jgi:hypothetical protein
MVVGKIVQDGCSVRLHRFYAGICPRGKDRPYRRVVISVNAPPRRLGKPCRNSFP